MTLETLTQAITAAGVAQLCVLVASALVPIQLDWKKELGGLRKLLRQMYWVYGGYVVLGILANGLISIANAREIAEGSGLAKSFCLYVMFFWGIRLSLQAVFDVKEHLTRCWLRIGYHVLTALFAGFTLFYGWLALVR